MNLILSDNELLIRKWWLRVFLVQCVYEIILTLSNPLTPPFMKILTCVLIALVRFAIFYYGYMKMGTRWLTVILWGFWISMSIMACFLLGSLMNFQVCQIATEKTWESISQTGVFLTALNYPISFIYIYLTTKLRKINKSRKSPQIQIVSN